MSFSDLFTSYQINFEQQLSEVISQIGPSSRLRDACQYALMNGGKRFRPFLVHLMAKALNSSVEVLEAALAVEFFHTASLIADDLPCMDNDDMRRNKPSLHKVYDEATALLASYALIAAGYEFLAKNAQRLRVSHASYKANSDKIVVLALENATYNTGLHGATGGQYLDIYPADLKEDAIKEIIRMKTVSLFEISFVLGWLYGGGALDQLELVKKAAYHFGMAFQIADDFGDVEQDATNGRLVNVVAICGFDKALEMFHKELKDFSATINQLKLNCMEIDCLYSFLEKQVVGLKKSTF